MKKLILTTLVIGVLLLAGCAPFYPSPFHAPPTYVPSTLTPTPTPTPPVPILPAPTLPVDSTTLEPPENVTWISPGKVMVANFHPGARAEYPITVHNGKDMTCTYLVVYRFPSQVAEGYSKPVPEVQDWIIIADSTPVLAPKETKDILIALAMPSDAISPAPKWEFWISVIEKGQSIVQTELCSRWLVSMR